MRFGRGPGATLVNSLAGVEIATVTIREFAAIPASMRRFELKRVRAAGVALACIRWCRVDQYRFDGDYDRYLADGRTIDPKYEQMRRLEALRELLRQQKVCETWRKRKEKENLSPEELHQKLERSMANIRAIHERNKREMEERYKDETPNERADREKKTAAYLRLILGDLGSGTGGGGDDAGGPTEEAAVASPAEDAAAADAPTRAEAAANVPAGEAAGADVTVEEAPVAAVRR